MDAESRRGESRETSSHADTSPATQQSSGRAGNKQRHLLEGSVPSLVSLSRWPRREKIPRDTGLPSQVSASAAPETACSENAGSHQPAGIRVVTIPSIKERLKYLGFTPKSNTIAGEDATFEKDDRTKLQDFMNFFRNHNSELCHGLPSRDITATLVKISSSGASASSSAAAPTYICIRGFRSDYEIAKYHVVLSQRTVRNTYKPLRLCYEKASMDLPL